MDPTRSFFVAAVTADFDGWKRSDVYELPDGVQSFTLQEFLDYPEVKKIINSYINEFQDTLDAVDVHLMFDPETMSGTKPLWRISTNALRAYYSLTVDSLEKELKRDPVPVDTTSASNRSTQSFDSSGSMFSSFSWGIALVFAACGAFALPMIILLVACMIDPHGHIGDLTWTLIPGAIGGIALYAFLTNR